MSEPTTTPLAERALQRLHKIAEGNGMAPDAIHLFSAEENSYDIEGTIILSPLFESQSGRYPGNARGSGRKIMAGAAALRTEVERLKKAFETKAGWITEAIAQLKEQDGGGWGLDDVRISLPNESIILAATEICPSCHGAKMMTCHQCGGHGAIVCTHCQGNRQEICPICIGTGKNPAMPDQHCLNCNGLRYAPCRYCHGRGQLTCPTCHGSRGTTCTACRGAGSFTEEVIINCGARTAFRLKADGLPSGLRRGLDRLGIANLAKGHADIETLPPPDEDDEGEAPQIPGAEVKKEKKPKPEVHYRAHMPYADLRMNFDGKKVIVGVFGKKEVLLNVPPFLDRALEPARELLAKAIRGEADLEAALAARVMKDALKLQLTGMAHGNALRKIYPTGLSPKVAEEILASMRLALNRLTLRTRGIVAGVCAVVSAGIFAGLFLTPLQASLTQNVTMVAAAELDLGVLIAVSVVSWLMLSVATRIALQKRFPGAKHGLVQKTGKTGYAMLAAIIVAYAVILVLMPDKPQWLLLLMKMKFR